MAAVATIRGTAIRPGVSRNGRLYTRELLAAAAEQAQERIDAGEVLEMLTHHGAEDDSTRIVGRLTAVKQRPDGSVAFVAELAGTKHGQNIAKLVTPKKPFLKGVSIRGYWDGPVRTVQHEGREVQTGDVLVLDGLDFTKTPGVIGAGVEGVGDLTTESADGRTLIYESVSEATAAAQPVRKTDDSGPYADPGYRDGVKRLPIGTREHAERAWRKVAEVAESEYTAAQLKRVRGRIKKALRAHGVDVTTESTTTRLGDVTEYWGDRDTAGFCIDAYNGSLSLSLRSYGVEPAELRIVAQKAMDAAVNALHALDPDGDGDIDAGSAETDDDQMETAPSGATDAQLDRAAAEAQRLGVPPNALRETTPAAPAGASPDTQEVPAVSEPQTPAAETATPTPAPMIALTQEQFTQLLGRVGQPAATPAAETAPEPEPVQESEDERLARLITAGVATAMESFKAELRAEQQTAGPQRRGFVVQTKTTESDVPKDKPFHELPQQQRDQVENDALLRHMGFAQ